MDEKPVVLGVTLLVLKRKHCCLLTSTAPGFVPPFPLIFVCPCLQGAQRSFPLQRAGSQTWLHLSCTLCTVKVIPKEQDGAEDSCYAPRMAPSQFVICQLKEEALGGAVLSSVCCK